MSAADHLSEALFKTSCQFKVGQISVAYTKQDAPGTACEEEYKHVRLCAVGSTTCRRHWAVEEKALERDESVEKWVCVHPGTECSCVLCDDPGRRAR